MPQTRLVNALLRLATSRLRVEAGFPTHLVPGKTRRLAWAGQETGRPYPYRRGFAWETDIALWRPVPVAASHSGEISAMMIPSGNPLAARRDVDGPEECLCDAIGSGGGVIVANWPLLTG